MSGSYFTLNAKYNSLLALFNQFFPYPPSPYPPPADVMTLSTAQTATGLKTFSTLPQSSVVPTIGAQLVNKTYVDAQVGSTPDIDAVLGQGDIATGKQMLLNDAVGTNFTLYTPTEIQVSDGVNDTAFFQPTQLQYTDITGTISATWADIISGSASSNTLEEVLTADNEADLSIILKDNLTTPLTTTTISSSSIGFGTTSGDVAGNYLGNSFSIQYDGAGSSVGSGGISATIANQSGTIVNQIGGGVANIPTPPYPASDANWSINVNTSTRNPTLTFQNSAPFENSTSMTLDLNGLTHTQGTGSPSPNTDFTISTNKNLILTADNIDLSSTGRLIVPSLASADYLDYNAGTLTLKSDNVGYLTDELLLLENTNITAGNTTGVPSLEMYKSGRNGAIGDVVSCIQFNAKDGAGIKRSFGRIESTITTNTAPLNYDGALDFYSLINGVNNLVFRLNGADNENNSFRPLDMNGNALKTSTGDLSIDATSSTGTGNISVIAKAGAKINLDSNVLMNNSETLTIQNTAGTIYNIQEQNQINMANITNPANTNQHLLTTTSQQLRNDQTTTINRVFTNVSDATTTNITEYDTSIAVDVKKLTLETNLVRMNDYNSGTTEQVDITPVSITFQSSGSATDSLSVYNNSASGGEITWSNTTGTNGLAISSNQELKLETTGTADVVITSANDIDILATSAGAGTRDINITASGGVNLTTSSSLTMAINNDWLLTGSSIISGSSSGNSGQHLRIFINGTPYKIQLLND